MDISNLKRYACFGDGHMCSLNLRHDKLDEIQTYFKFEDVVELLKQPNNSDYAALVRKWTASAQNGSNTDAERNVYYQCAEGLHQLNAKHFA